MLRVYPQKGAAAAKNYYTKGLSREDYYTQEVVGLWHGKAAEALGLEGQVCGENFGKLVDNINPFTGGQLTPQTTPTASLDGTSTSTLRSRSRSCMA